MLTRAGSDTIAHIATTSYSSKNTMLGLGLLDVGVCTVAALVAFAIFLKNKTRHRYPPGPKGFPLLGNIFDLPSNCQWTAYAEWSRKLGELDPC